jgi:hypothetical protein
LGLGVAQGLEAFVRHFVLVLEICLRTDQVAPELRVVRGESPKPRRKQERRRRSAEDQTYDQPKCSHVSL